MNKFLVDTVDSKDKLIQYFRKGIKKDNELRIGVEHEKFLFNKSDLKRVDYNQIKKVFENLKNNENVYFICYEKLCNTSEYWLDILKILNIKETYNFEFKESNKVISLEMDEDITHKGLSLYKELSQYVLHE